MRIDNHDIVRTARQLRDEENEQLNVRPWGRRHGFRVPTWLVAIPAAAIIGFVLGFCVKGNSQLNTPLTALVDTVYIKVHDPQPRQDTVAATTFPVSEHSSPSRRLSKRGMVRTASPHLQSAIGRPVADDHIRYDLLVRN